MDTPLSHEPTSFRPSIRSQAQPEPHPPIPDLTSFRVRQSQQHAIGPMVPAPKPGSRGAVVKTGIIQASESSSLGEKTGRHLNYLSLDGHGAQAEKTDLFTREGQTVDPKAFRAQADQDTHQYHIILSLADGNRINMQRFTQDFMEQVEKDLDRRLDWVAAVHDSTGMRHAHIDIRGTDQKGTAVTLDTANVQGTDEGGNRFTIKTQYLHNGMRYRAQQLATDYLGMVPRNDRQNQFVRTDALQSFLDGHTKESTKLIESDSIPTIESSPRRTQVGQVISATPKPIQPLKAVVSQETEFPADRVTPTEKQEMIESLTPQAQAFLKSAVPDLFKGVSVPGVDSQKSLTDQVADLAKTATQIAATHQKSSHQAELSM